LPGTGCFIYPYFASEAGTFDGYYLVGDRGPRVPPAWGIIAAVIAKFEANLLVIIFSMLLVFMILSMLLGRMLPGERMDLILEVPPLRLPILKNVLIKTWIRLESFFTQVLPLMLVMSLIIRVLLERGAFQCLGGISSLTSFFLGIPGEAFIGVVITVVQRYLAPMVLLNLPLSAREATIASTMVSLSFPCLPVSILILKELGLRGLLKILVLAGVVPVIVGLLLNMILPA
jgi:ferrous iron transport protein B